MGKSYFLGIDCGTQSTKVLVYDLAGKKVVARGQAPHRLIAKDDGTREQEAIWWVDAMKKAMKSVPAAVRAEVKGIGVSGQQHGFVPMDASGKVLRAAKLWCDTATVVECEEIEKAFGGRNRVIAKVGNAILPGYTASKIKWLKNHHPDLYGRMATFLLPHDYLNFVLTGEQVMEFGDASGTGLLDIQKREWHPGILKALDPKRDWKATLPKLIPPHGFAGRLTTAAAKDLGLPAGIAVSAGGGDNMMGAIGTGTQKEGALTMSLGTSGTLYGYSSKAMIDGEGNLAAFCSSTGGYLPLLCTMNCTVATEQIRGFLKTDLKKMEQLAGAAPVGSDGVVTLPFFNGERTPNLPHGRASVMGLTPTNLTEANLLRSAMESAVFGLKIGLDSFIRLGFRPKEIRLIGGGSKSRLWRQMTADAFGLPVTVPVEEEAAALGGALQAAWAVSCAETGKIQDFSSILDRHVAMDPKATCKPKSADASKWQKAFETYQKYLSALAPLYR